MCVRERVRESKREWESERARESQRQRERGASESVCVCWRKWECVLYIRERGPGREQLYVYIQTNISVHTSIYMYTYDQLSCITRCDRKVIWSSYLIYIHMYMCMYMYVCMCVYMYIYMLCKYILYTCMIWFYRVSFLSNLYIYMYTYMDVCVCIHIYIHILCISVWCLCIYCIRKHLVLSGLVLIWCLFVLKYKHSLSPYGVVTIIRALEGFGIFCKRAL